MGCHPIVRSDQKIDCCAFIIFFSTLYSSTATKINNLPVLHLKKQNQKQKNMPEHLCGSTTIKTQQL